jgi:hypothetical protein
MQIIGFNYNKISSQKSEDFTEGKAPTMNLEFTDIKEESSTPFANKKALLVKFQYILDYMKTEKKKEVSQADITIEGTIILAAEKKEVDKIIKEWKKKKIDNRFKIFIFNFILKKCSAKAILLQEELNLPNHIPMPQLNVQKVPNQDSDK